MTFRLSCIFAALVLLAFPASAESEPGSSGQLTPGAVIYLSTRLESITKSPGRKAVAGWSRPGAGIMAWEERGPYVVEACTPLKVRKVVAAKALVVTRDHNGIKHTLAGDWSGRIHAGEMECRESSGAHSVETVRENEKLQYELARRQIPQEPDGAAQSTLP